MKLLKALISVILTLPLIAQSPAHKPAPTIPALFLSDIHLDPFADPAKAAKLNAAPASDWPAIFASPTTPTQPADDAALRETCPVRGIDTSYTLWHSTLKAMHTDAANAKFATITGDFLAHEFDCKYKALFPSATPEEFLAFVDKTYTYLFSSLHLALPGIPLYSALGNNDTACNGNHLDANGSYLAHTAPIFADALHAPPADRPAILRDLSAGGYYSIPLPALDHTRLLVVDDLFFLTEYHTCAGVTSDRSEEAAQIAWLKAQLDQARRRHENVWVLGHIPTGVTLYTTFLRKKKICDGEAPAMSLDSEAFAQTLADNADIVRLAIFAHTHSDAFAIIPPGLGDPAPATPARPNLGPGVPVKVIASISPVNGNNPSFTLAKIDPNTATLADYTVIEASNQTGIDTTWAKQYTYSEDFAEPDFSATSLTDLIGRLRADPSASSPASQSYLRHHYSTGATADILKAFWPVYVCAMDHDSGSSFAACACATSSAPLIR